MRSAMNLFAYGTLMNPEVWVRVTGRTFRCAAATLQSYAVRRLHGHDFPGILPVPGQSARGLVYFDLDADTFARLDAYEDDFYQRTVLTVELCGSGTAEEAGVYLIQPAFHTIVAPEPWVPDFPVPLWLDASGGR